MKVDLEYTDEWNRKKIESESKLNYYKDKTLTVEKIDGGIVLPAKIIERDLKTGVTTLGGGVLNKYKKYLDISSQRAGGYNISQGYQFDGLSLDFLNKTVVYMGVYIDHWGHFICDSITRLWYVLQKEPDAIVAYISADIDEVSSEIRIKGNNLEFVKLLDLKEEQFLLVDKPMQFRKVIIPERSCVNGPNVERYYTKEHRDLFEGIKNNIEKKNDQKIYYTRTGLCNGRESGEKDIETFFEINGYKIISPEKYTVKEQIAYLKGAKEIAALQGTLSHNILFAEDGIKITIINKLCRINPYQSLINHLRDADITYIDAYWTLVPTRHGIGPFILTFNKNFKKFADDRQMQEIPAKADVCLEVTQMLWYLLNFISRNESLPKFDKEESESLSDIYTFYRKQLSKEGLEALYKIADLLFYSLNKH